MDKNAIRELFVHAFKGTSPDVTKYSAKDVKDTLAEKIHEIAYDLNSYRRNKLDLFQILQEAYDEIIPEYVGNFVGQFAEVKTVPRNTKAMFTVKRGRRRAKTFITEVGLSGVYESFRLDVDTFEVAAKAIGGAAYIDFERSLTGDEDITESANLLLEGLQEAIYREIMKCLMATVLNGDMPAANQVESDGFDPESMVKLCNIAKSYGGSAVIFATPEFVAKMGPDAIGMPVYGAHAFVGFTVPQILLLLQLLVILLCSVVLLSFSFLSNSLMKITILIRFLVLSHISSQLVERRSLRSYLKEILRLMIGSTEIVASRLKSTRESVLQSLLLILGAYIETANLKLLSMQFLMK